MQVQIPLGMQHKKGKHSMAHGQEHQEWLKAGEWTAYLLTGLPFSDLQFEDNHLKTH